MKTNHVHSESDKVWSMVSLLADALSAKSIFLSPSPAVGFVNGMKVRRPDAVPAQPTPHKAGLFERIDRWFWLQRQRDREAFLAKSENIFELEQRLRWLERGTGDRYY